MAGSPSPSTGADAASILELRGIRKAYGPTIALAGATVSCGARTVHGVIGENGAGKSTLMKILAGVVRPDAGEIAIDGEVRSHLSVRESFGHGVAVAHQELSLVRSLTVAENLLGAAYDRPGVLWKGLRLKPKAVHRYAAEVLGSFGVDWLGTGQLVEELDLASMQSLEIVKALARSPRILVLDEPTSALNAVHVAWLMDQIAAFVAGGGTVLYISHRLSEIRALCASVTVMREGRDVAVVNPGTVDDDELFSLIAGERRSKLVGLATHVEGAGEPAAESGSSTGPAAGRAGQSGPPRLEVRELVTARSPHPLSFEVGAGEVLGLAALQGHGQSELLETLFGVQGARSGSIFVDGKPVTLRSTKDAIRAGVGMALVPEDRKTEGVLLDLGVTANLTLPVLSRISMKGFVSQRRERRQVEEVAAAINLSPDALGKRVSELSGGNQQKVAIGRWLLARSRVLLLHDPTRGVDVGTKEEIFALIRRYADDGGAVIFHSTDLDEMLIVPDRVLVLYDGRIVGEQRRESLEGDRLVSSMLGSTSTPSASSASSAPVDEREGTRA